LSAPSIPEPLLLVSLSETSVTDIPVGPMSKFHGGEPAIFAEKL
jgi:hypothetical protein